MSRDERGAVAVIFSLSLLVLMLAIGVAVDYSRALAYYSRTQSALDATALAVARAAGEGATDTQMEQIGQAYFDQATKGMTNGVVFSKVDIKLDIKTNEARARVAGKVRTVIGKIVGFTSIDKDLMAAVISSGKDIELGMMLDVSGSMKGAKIAALKVAAKDLVDTLKVGGSDKRKARIGIVPYSTSVNLGVYSEAAKGASKEGDEDKTCVSERKGAHAFTDANPRAGGPMGKKATDCPKPVIQPLSDDKDAIENTIDGLQADGSTAGHLGIAWAWYMVSEKWRNFWPEENAPAENDAKLLKAVVLMTDGEFNTEYEHTNGKSAQQAEKLCANMKAEGVMVFTVAFDAPDEVKPLFAECASIPGYAFEAKDGAGLKKSFARIAQYLNDLRITQ